MIIDTQKIQKQLQELFPALLDWLPTDRQYLTVEPDYVRLLVDNLADKDNRYIPSLWECEEIAAAFMVDVRRWRLNNLDQLSVDQRKNLAIGEALGTKWNGQEKSHHANIFIAEAGVYLLDLQIKKFWKAEKGADDIYFVRI